MSKPKTLLLTVTAVLAMVVLTTWWFQRPERTKEAFAGHLYHQRYEEAARLLRAPSSMAIGPDGGLVLVDEAGRRTVVPATKLPFVVGGHEAPEHPGDFRMTALGPSTNGVLDTPAVTLHLSVDGGEVRLEAVDS